MLLFLSLQSVVDSYHSRVYVCFPDDWFRLLKGRETLHPHVLMSFAKIFQHSVLMCDDGRGRNQAEAPLFMHGRLANHQEYGMYVSRLHHTLGCSPSTGF
jgi:hypothetical protein